MDEFLKGMPVVKFDGKTISIKFLKGAIRYRVKKKRNVKNVADWNKDFVYYDEKIPQENLIPVLVHECIEKYVSEKYGLDVDKKSHKIATEIEKSLVIRMKGNWRSHQRRIAETWKKANKQNVGRNKFF